MSTHPTATAAPSATTSPTEPLDLVLHIGSGKTGTSSLQRLLHKNRQHLAELDTLFPRSPGLARHARLGLFIKPDAALVNQFRWQRQNYSSPAEFREDFRHKLFAEINSSGLGRVLLSDEALYRSAVPALKRLRAFTDAIARSIRVVVYLRRQDDHVCSRYQHLVRLGAAASAPARPTARGEVRRLAEWLEEVDFTRIYDYHARLHAWQRLMEPSEFVIRPFERERFVDGSLYQDFFEAAGLEARADDLVTFEPLNESLDAEAVELLRILNVYQIENEAATQSLISNREVVARLADSATGPTLTLPDSVLDEFMDSWEGSNRAVARDFLGDDTGQLFRAPRKTHNTTTEQRLDPARLDHFITLLELPKRMHSPLRRLVEREAKAC